jgi:hypothetical protein
MEPDTQHSENDYSEVEHYHLTKDQNLHIAYISQLRDEVNKALVHRPIPMGRPYSNLSEAIAQPLDEIQSALLGMEEVVNELNCLFDFHPDNIVDDIAPRLTKTEKNILKWITIYHRIWKRPFPEGMETIQMIASAIPERVLRDILIFFEQLIAISNDPDQAVKKHGSESMTVRLSIDVDSEVERLVLHQEQLESDASSETSSIGEPPTRMPKTPILGFTLLAISLLFIFSMFASGEILMGIITLLVLLALLLSGK